MKDQELLLKKRTEQWLNKHALEFPSLMKVYRRSKKDFLSAIYLDIGCTNIDPKKREEIILKVYYSWLEKTSKGYKNGYC